jgi:hypothetical protein
LNQVDLLDVAVFADDDLAGDRAVPHLHESGVHRVVQRDGRIVFRLDRADRNAVGVAGAGTPIAIGLGIPRGRKASDANLLDPVVLLQEPDLIIRHGVERRADGLVCRRLRNLRHRVIFGYLDAEELLVTLVRRYAEFHLGVAVEALQTAVIDFARPIDELAVCRFHLEIVRDEPEAGAEPVRGSTGDTIIVAGERARAGLDEIALLWVGPVAEAAAFGPKRQHRGAAGVHGGRVG